MHDIQDKWANKPEDISSLREAVGWNRMDQGLRNPLLAFYCHIAVYEGMELIGYEDIELRRIQILNIIKNSVAEEMVGAFIDKAFADYAKTNDVDLNFEEYWFVAENDSGDIIGSITGRAYYNEVHIGDLIIEKKYRGQGIGTKLVIAVEEEYRNKGFEKITLTTFGFQAPIFYKKLGYSLEFVREDKNPKLSKYFYCKSL